jgi:hypothetical protein
MENQNKSAVKRLQSLDALRGFDMFWIMGGEGIFIGLASLSQAGLFFNGGQVSLSMSHGMVSIFMI